MTEPLAQARALLEHFRSEVLPSSWVAGGDQARSVWLKAPVFAHEVILVRVTPKVAGGFSTTVVVPMLPASLSPDDIARVGGMLIQISNLVRQIITLAGGSASDSSRSKTAV